MECDNFLDQVKYNVVSNIGVKHIKHSRLCRRFDQFVKSFILLLERERELVGMRDTSP